MFGNMPHAQYFVLVTFTISEVWFSVKAKVILGGGLIKVIALLEHTVARFTLGYCGFGGAVYLL